MKILSLACGFILLFVSATCSNTNNLEPMVLTGTVEESGITSYQYGTHILSTEKTFHALKSEEVNLDNYVGKTVSLKVERIQGYPVDGGPDYYNVLEVE